MTLSPRQQRIIEKLDDTNGVLSSVEITSLFNVSVQTIRKDLNELSKLGYVRRVHGGIALMPTSENLPFDSRQYLNGDAKKKIARALVNEIPDRSSIFLGIGTTVEHVAHELVRHKGLQVFTNNLMVAAILSNMPHIQVKMTGGNLRHSHRDLIGAETLDSIRQYYFDYGILGCGGLDQGIGLLDFDPDEASLTRTLVDSCRCSILVVDQSKWGRKAMARVKTFREIDKIYTDYLTPEQSDVLIENQVQVSLCI